MLEDQNISRPTLLLVHAKGIERVIGRYPVDFRIMLPRILACLIQGIVDESDVKDQLYEDGCGGLLEESCHCYGRIPSCPDCEGRLQIDALACGYIEAILNTLTASPSIVSSMRHFTNSCDFYEFEVSTVDVDTIIIMK